MAKQRKRKNTNLSKKTSPKKQTSSSSFLKKYWQEKSSVYKFIAAFFGCMVLFYAMYYSLFFENYLKGPILEVQTSAGATLLNLFGMPVSSSGDVIAGSGISVQVAGGCDGLEATALLLAAILVFPLPFKFKWPGLLAGLLTLTVLNVIRIAGLYLVKLHWPSGFDFMHIQGGLYLFSFVTILLMLIWANWALKGYKNDQLLKS